MRKGKGTNNKKRTKCKRMFRTNHNKTYRA